MTSTPIREPAVVKSEAYPDPQESLRKRIPTLVKLNCCAHIVAITRAATAASGGISREKVGYASWSDREAAVLPYDRTGTLKI
eukprot:CAMPEP_0173441906 /NCGR_PEP_ID=MMETSP1357-20121228/24244_1 /TAXON_ID=77926 /ORGANISM="Hemiselmis rufescens, Strain PCC563" /LENGTH=82 /DNA_ID=CAMNT_0014407519 /DNA_START=29 /DNA_END=274 /DNA_ORIENTATION=-